MDNIYVFIRDVQVNFKTLEKGTYVKVVSLGEGKGYEMTQVDEDGKPIALTSKFWRKTLGSDLRKVQA